MINFDKDDEFDELLNNLVSTKVASTKNNGDDDDF